MWLPFDEDDAGVDFARCKLLEVGVDVEVALADGRTFDTPPELDRARMVEERFLLKRSSKILLCFVPNKFRLTLS